MDTAIYECIYCHKPCRIDQRGDKYYLVCPICGTKEATKMLVARLRARGVIGNIERCGKK